jgi:hypothetical protein
VLDSKEIVTIQTALLGAYIPIHITMSSTLPSSIETSRQSDGHSTRFVFEPSQCDLDFSNSSSAKSTAAAAAARRGGEASGDNEAMTTPSKRAAAETPTSPTPARRLDDAPVLQHLDSTRHKLALQSAQEQAAEALQELEAGMPRMSPEGQKTVAKLQQACNETVAAIAAIARRTETVSREGMAADCVEFAEANRDIVESSDELAATYAVEEVKAFLAIVSYAKATISTHSTTTTTTGATIAGAASFSPPEPDTFLKLLQALTETSASIASNAREATIVSREAIAANRETALVLAGEKVKAHVARCSFAWAPIKHLLPTSADTGSTEEDAKNPAAATIPCISNSNSTTTETTNAVDTAVTSAAESECIKTRFSAISATMPPSSQQAFVAAQLEKGDKQAEDAIGVLLKFAKSVENIVVANSNERTSVLNTFLHHQERDGEDADESSSSDDNNSL